MHLLLNLRTQNKKMADADLCVGRKKDNRELRLGQLVRNLISSCKSTRIEFEQTKVGRVLKMTRRMGRMKKIKLQMVVVLN